MMESVAEVTNFGTADVQRCVIVRKDEKGYGLTVSGDNPVRIQSIKDGGAASKAGVQEGDIIIKVNGTLVTNSNHAEVVKLIKAAGSYVALTLLGKHQGPSPVPAQQAPFTPQLMEESKKGQITAPTPASNIQVGKRNKSDDMTQYYSEERMETLSRYLESEKQTFILIQDSYNESPSEKLKKDMLGTRNRIKVLEAQIVKESQRMRAMPTIQEPYSDTLNENVPSHQTDRRGSDRGLRGNHYRQRSSPDQELYSQIPAQEGTRGSSQVKRNRSDVQDRGRDKKGPRRDNAVRYNNSKRTSRDVEMTRAQTLPGDEHEEDQEDSRLRSSTVGVMEDMGGGGGRNPMEMNLFNPTPTNPTSDMFAPAANQRRSTDIMTMEDEFPSDQEMFDEHGPFDKLEELEKKPAHLAVFLHYLISNKDPSSLFFYLVIESFKAGSPKDMKKWSYEIYSTFIANNSPMKVESITEETAKTIESEMSTSGLPDDKMKMLFDQAQGQAVLEVVDLLAEFRRNRSLGLGTLFGEQQLTQENMEKSQEIKIAEQILMPHLDRLMDSTAKREDKDIALASALSTFMRQIGVKVSGNSSLERCPSFATKEKKGRTRPSKKHVKGHQFQEKHYTSTAFCQVCNGLLWGIGNQGLCCQDCELNLHRNDVCIERLTFQCPGKSGRKARVSGIRGMIPSKVQNLKPSNLIGGKGEEPERQMVTSPGGMHQTIVERLEEDNEEIETIRGQGRVHNLISQFGNSGALPPEGGVFTNSGDEVPYHISPGEKLKKVQRSSSLKNDREPRNHRGRSGERRSKSDVDMDQNLVAAAISRGGDPGSQSSLSGRSQDSISSISEMRTYTDDSDMEAEQDTPNWQGKVDKTIIKKLKPKEVKRQEIINELFHTERTHVRNLKVLDKVFYQPMLSEGVLPKETVMHLFPNLPELIEEHSILNARMKKDKSTSQVVRDVGNLLIERFDGEAGKRMKEVSADFCINQRHCLEMIKSKQRKETKLNNFITEAEADPLCRRLPLRGIISTQMQRLTKYPLFIQQLLKYTQSKTEENQRLERALQCCKDLLDHVNQAVREADNRHRLVEIKSKTELTPYERTTKGNPDEVNTSQIFHKLLYDSPITWKLSRNKTLDMHAMLLEEYVVLLQKQDDKFILKFHSTSNIAPITDRDQNPTNNKRNTHSPIIKLSTTLFREVATSNKAFFLISTSQQGPQIYELQAPSSNEKKVWMDLIKSAQDNVKRRNSGRGVNPMNLPQRPEYHHNLDKQENNNSVNASVERAERSKVVTKTPEVVTQVPFTTPTVVEEQGDAATLLKQALDEPVGNDADSRESMKYIILLMQRLQRLSKEQGLDQLILDGLEKCHREMKRAQGLHVQEVRSVEDECQEERLTTSRQAQELNRLRQELDKRTVGASAIEIGNGQIVTDLDQGRNRLSYSADSNSSATDDSEGPEHDYEQVTEIAELRAADSGDSSENTLRPVQTHRLEPIPTQVATEVAGGQLYDLREAERTAQVPDREGVKEGGQEASCIQEDGVMTLTTSRIESMQLSEVGPEGEGDGTSEPENPYMTLAEAHTGTTGDQLGTWDQEDRRTSMEGYEKVEEFVPPMTAPVQAETIGAATGFGSTEESLSSYTDEASGGDVAQSSPPERPEGGATPDIAGSVDEGSRLKDSKPDSAPSTSSCNSSRPNSMLSADSGSEDAKLDNSSPADGKDSEESDDRTLQVKPAEVIPELVDDGADQQTPSSPSSDGSKVRKSLVLSDSLDDPGTDVDNPMLGERLLIVESMSDLSVASDHTSGDGASMDLAVKEDAGQLENKADYSAGEKSEDKVKQTPGEDGEHTENKADHLAGEKNEDEVKQMAEKDDGHTEMEADHPTGKKSEDVVKLTAEGNNGYTENTLSPSVGEENEDEDHQMTEEDTQHTESHEDSSSAAKSGNQVKDILDEHTSLDKKEQVHGVDENGDHVEEAKRDGEADDKNGVGQEKVQTPPGANNRDKVQKGRKEEDFAEEGNGIEEAEDENKLKEGEALTPPGSEAKHTDGGKMDGGGEVKDSINKMAEDHPGSNEKKVEQTEGDGNTTENVSEVGKELKANGNEEEIEPVEVGQQGSASEEGKEGERPEEENREVSSDQVEEGEVTDKKGIVKQKEGDKTGQAQETEPEVKQESQNQFESDGGKPDGKIDEGLGDVEEEKSLDLREGQSHDDGMSKPELDEKESLVETEEKIIDGEIQSEGGEFAEASHDGQKGEACGKDELEKSQQKEDISIDVDCENQEDGQVKEVGGTENQDGEKVEEAAEGLENDHSKSSSGSIAICERMGSDIPEGLSGELASSGIVEEPAEMGDLGNTAMENTDMDSKKADSKEHPENTGDAESEAKEEQPLAATDLNRNVSDSDGEKSIPSDVLKVVEGDESEASSCPQQLDDLLLTESLAVPNVTPGSLASFEYDSDSIDGCEELV